MKKSLFFLALLPCLFIVSCKPANKDLTPSPEFARYITAYTGGVITPHSAIQIQLAQPQPSVQVNTPIKEQLFSFKPALKGTAYWVNNRCIEFFPDEGALQQGQLYQAEFKLGKIQQAESKFNTFAFSFRVEKQSFMWESEPCIITAATPNSATVRGQIRFNNSVSAEKVARLFTVNIAKIAPKVEGTSDPKTFTITFEDIPLTDREQTFRIEIKGKAMGIDKTVQDEVVIPQSGLFYPLSVRALSQPELGVEVVFSQALQPNQNLRGLVSITGAGSSYVYQIEENRVRVFFERRPAGEIGVAVYRGVKSASGKVIEYDASYSVAFASIHPQVVLPFPGTILPDSKNLILPFRTVNLSAVDIRIIRIFEHNILSFMQSNTLNTTYELRRYGRLIQKKTLWLDRETDIKQDSWHNFSIDLSTLMKQEPGAIYHIDISFQQAYSLYPGANALDRNASGQKLGDSPTEPPSQGMVFFNGSNLSEKEEAFWDETQSYYYGYNDIDWSLYNWNEAGDPSKPSFYMSRRRSVFCNVIGSNLGIIAKGGAQNKLWITVSDITTVKPVKDAQITVYNYQLQQIGMAATDSDGFAVVEPNGKPFVMTAKHQGQTSYLRLADGEEKSLSRFDVGGREVQRGLKGYIYGERGVWRPGDTLFLSFILEDKLQRLPASHPVTFELYNPHGQFYHKETVTSGVNGFYTFKTATNEEDPTGLWNAYVKVGGSSFHKSLRVETVKPNRLKINLTIPNDRIDASQREVTANLAVSWLTGAVARNLNAKVEMQLSASSAPFAGYERYIFRNPATDFSSDEFEIFDGNLDANGDARIRFNAPRTDYAPGMLRANLVCRVFEPGGDASVFSQSIPFSPFDTYVGINLHQKKGEWMETDTDHTFDVVTLSAQGALKEAGDLEYTIYRLNWNWWWEHSSESFAAYVNNRSRTPEASGKVSMKNGKGTIPFRIEYPSWGRYLVYVKDPKGGHATGDVVYVDWPSWRGRAMASDPSGITMLSFSTDKTAYQVGETVTVMIPSATSGKALVALENGSSVLSRNWVNVSSHGNSRYSFKVTPEMAPNFYLHVSLLQPHAQSANDLPVRMYGVVPILVENKEAQLAPKIDMPDVLRPEEPFTIRVSEQSGKPMTYTLAIVDDGLLDLTNFRTPDPYSEFYAREALGVRTWDIYDHIIGSFGQKYGALFSIGGDQSLNPSGQRANRFKPVVKFLGPFTLKKGENRRHPITLPPYIGSVRVMVVAGSTGAYGNTQKTVPVRAPLMLLSTLPRLLGTGEEIALPVHVFAMEDGVKDVTIKVETSSNITIVGSSAQSHRFTQPGDETKYFTIKAGNQTGAERVRVTATGNGYTATETIDIQIRNPNPMVVTATQKLLETQKEEAFAYELAGDAHERSVTLEVSRIPSVDLKRRFDWLENYEHACTEQLTSKGFPWLYIEQFKEVDKDLAVIVKTNVTEAIKNIYGRQLSNGGFVCWPGQSWADEWISSYAGHFLLKAKEKGYEVNEGVLRRWRSYQQSCTRNWSPQNTKYGGFNDFMQAYRLYTLALADSPETGAMNRLREHKDLSPQAKWRLAAAYAIDGKQRIASELIWNASPLVESHQNSRYTYGSTLRDEAMILEAMVLMNNMEAAFSLARTISQKLSNASWFDTQSTAFSLIAMGALADKAGKGEINVEWSVNGAKQKAIVSAKPVYQIDLPSSTLPSSGSLSIQNNGGGTLYVRLISQSRPFIDTSPAMAHNLKIDVSYTDLSGRPLDPSRLQQGADFMSVVTVSNIGGIDYTDIALTHIIPTGWEVFNERMAYAQEDDSSHLFTYQDIRDDRVLTYFNLPSNRSKSFRIRLQASYAGSYTLPAISCEAMYDTGARAKTAAGRVEVVR